LNIKETKSDLRGAKTKIIDPRLKLHEFEICIE